MKYSIVRDVFFLCYFLIECGLLSAASPALAADSPTIMQTMQLFEGTIKFPLPTWQKIEDGLGDVEVSRKQEKNAFSLEQIPKGQAFDSWTRLYGVYGWYLPDYDMKRFIEESLNALSMGCKVQTRFTLISANSANIIMTYHCDDLTDVLVQGGNSAESGFLYISQVNNTFAKVCQAWRGKADDLKANKWPITKQAATDAVHDMQTIRFIGMNQDKE